MPTDPAQPRPHMPDEADLLAWVEGEPLPRDREATVRRAMMDDKGLARRLEAMRADRGAIKSLPDVSAPPSLMAAVEAALQPVLERQMLLGLREGEPVHDHPPISIVRPMRRSIVQAFFADRMGRRMAMAAGLLLVVGGATLLATTYWSGKTAPRPFNTLANATPETDPAATLAEASKQGSTPHAKAVVPADPPKETPAEVRPARIAAEATGVEPAPVIGPEAPAPLAVAEGPAPDYDPTAMGPFLPDLDGSRAADLARDGRLVIRLKSVDPSLASNPSRIADRMRQGDGWRLGDDASPQVLALLEVPAANVPGPEPRPDPEAPAMADSDLLPDMYGPPRPPPIPIPQWNPVLPPQPTVYIVQARLDGGTLEALRSTLAGNYGEAVFEELAEPLPQDGPGAVNPTSVVWWASGPTGWTRWANVPVVIDTAR